MRYKFQIPMFKQYVFVYVGEDERERYEKDTRKVYGDELEFKNGDVGRTVGSYIFMKDVDLNTLVHEVCHLTDNFISHVGIKDEQKEVEAYVTAWGVTTIWKSINKN